MIKHSTNLPKAPEARAGKVPRRKRGTMNEKIKTEPRDITAARQLSPQLTPVQIAQTAALINIAAAMLEAYANISAVSGKQS